MKIAVVGAGAMGSFYGAHLSKKNEVFLIDVWKEHVDKINAEGLCISEPDGSSATYNKLKALTDASQAPVMDCVLFFVKSIYTASAMETAKPLIGPNTILVTLQNGYGNDEDMAKGSDLKNIVLGTSSHGCTVKGPAHIFHAGSGATHVGGASDCLDAANAFAKALNDVGIETYVEDNARRVVLDKLFVNIGINALTALLDVDNGKIESDEFLRKASKDLVFEAVKVIEADGISFDFDAVLENVYKVAKLTSANCSSMRADVSKKRQTEIMKINGIIVKIAERNNVGAPLNKQITDLILAKESNY